MNNYNGSLDQHPSRFKLDSYITASCSSDDRMMIELHCLSCKECKEYLITLSDSSKVVTSQFPDLKTLDKVYSAKRGSKQLILNKAMYNHPLFRPAIAALLVFALIIPAYFIMNADRGEYLQVKGSPEWLLFTKSQFVHNEGHEINVHAYDTVQLFLQAARPLYFTIMYQDDDGPLNVYNTDNVVLRNASDGKPVPLPFSIVLDSLWNRQNIYCIASESKLSADAITSAIKNYEQFNNKTTGFWIRKFTLYRK
jgi:hypothetical protein